MHAIEIHDRTRVQRDRIAVISAELRNLPSYRRGGEDFEAMLRERSELLQEIDKMSRPCRSAPPPGPKSVRDARTTAKAIGSLAAEQRDEAKADAARTRARAGARLENRKVSFPCSQGVCGD